MDRLEAMRAFTAVATLGSFAEAARQLRISPSATTRLVADLEERLGLVLLNRTTRSVRLTEGGELYLERCRRVLEDVDDAERAARGQGAEPRGVLKITAPVLFGRLYVMPIVNQVLAEHRQLSIRLVLSDRNMHLIEEDLDVAIRIGDLADSSLIAVRLGGVSRLLVASPDYLMWRSAPRGPADLTAHDVIAFEGIDATNEWRFEPSGKIVRVQPRLMVNCAESAIAAAEAGLGITRALSYQVKAGIAAGRLVPVLPQHTREILPVSAVYPARRIASANRAAFLSAAKAYLKTHSVTPFDEWAPAATAG
ncbi:LysR family transcriptional regulator [Beijerinckiaceae bacterium]|nr:LysR family transcriptional regulator [Beijerinckiaceae bacterium]